MKVTFFYRNQSCGMSIQRVFRTVAERLRATEHVNLCEHFMPSANSMPWSVVRNCFYTYRRRDRKGINHVTGHIHDVLLALVGCKTVLTVHDLVFLDNTKNPVKRFYKWLFWLYIPINLANRVTCISKETKSNLAKYVNADKIRVIYNPIDDQFIYTPKDFNESNPTILHIGTGWNKNLLRTVEALNGLKCHLRIVGKISDEVLKVLEKFQIDYSFVFNISDKEIIEEYRKCDIVSFPSLYEGFGMPIIEGQATGRVVIASNIEPLIEVSGDAVMYVDPNSVESIREGYVKILESKAIREEMIANGLLNVKRFEQNVVVNQYLSIYNDLYEQ